MPENDLFSLQIYKPEIPSLAETLHIPTLAETIVLAPQDQQYIKEVALTDSFKGEHMITVNLYGLTEHQFHLRKMLFFYADYRMKDQNSYQLADGQDDILILPFSTPDSESEDNAVMKKLSGGTKPQGFIFMGSQGIDSDQYFKMLRGLFTIVNEELSGLNEPLLLFKEKPNISTLDRKEMPEVSDWDTQIIFDDYESLEGEINPKCLMERITIYGDETASKIYNIAQYVALSILHESDSENDTKYPLFVQFVKNKSSNTSHIILKGRPNMTSIEFGIEKSKFISAIDQLLVSVGYPQLDF